MRYTYDQPEYLDVDGARHLVQELKVYIQEILNGNIDITQYATKEELSNAVSSIDLTDYAKTTDIPSLEGYATKSYVDENIANVATGGEVDLSNYVTKDTVYTKEDVYTKEETDAKITEIEPISEDDIRALFASEGLATEEYVDNAVSNIPTTDLTGYATEKYVDNAISNIDIPTGGNVDLSNYYNKEETEGLVNEVDLYEKAKEQGGVIKNYYPATPDSMYEIIKSSGTSPNVRFSLNTTEWNIEKYVGGAINDLGTSHDFSVDRIVLASTVSKEDLLNKVDATVLLADNDGIWMYEITDGEVGRFRKFSSKNHSSLGVIPCDKLSDAHGNNLCPDFTNTFFHYDCGLTVVHPLPNDFDLLDYVTPVYFKYIPLGYFRNNSGTLTYSSDNTFDYIGSTYTLNSEGIVKSILDDYFVVKSVEEYTEYYTRDEWALLLDNATKNEANVDLSNYYTKDETYSKTEVDTLVANSGGSSSGGETTTPTVTLAITGNASLKNGFARTYKAVYTDADGTDVTANYSTTWELTSDTVAVDSYITQEVGSNQNKLLYEDENEDVLEETVTLTAIPSDSNIANASIELTLTSAF